MTKSDQLFEHAKKSAIPFRTSLGYPWAIVSDNSGNQRVFPVSSYGFRFWLKLSFHNQHSINAGSSTIEAAVRKFYIFAQSSELCEGDVATRIAWRGARNLPEAILVNLVNKHDEAVEITPGGRHISRSERRQFVEASWALPLSRPVDNGLTLRDQLKTLLNLDGTALDRAVLWLFAALRPAPPYPVLVVSGPQGSGKTILLQLLRSLIDPSAVPMQDEPENDHILFAQAMHNSVLVYDSGKALPQAVLHSLGRLASGTGIGQHDGASPHAGRPIMISTLDTPCAFIENAISIQLPERNSEDVIAEKDLADRYQEAAAPILGTLCDAASAALSNFALTEVPANCRLPEVHKWALSAGGILGLNNGQIVSALANIPIVDALRALIERQPEWSGTAAELSARFQDVGYTAPDPARLVEQLNSVPLPMYGISLDQINMGKQRLLRLTPALRTSSLRSAYRSR